MVLSAFGMFSITGNLSIIWREIEERSKVHRLFLPNEEIPIENVLQKTFIDFSILSCPAIGELSKQIQRFLEGEGVNFELNTIALEECSGF